MFFEDDVLGVEEERRRRRRRLECRCREVRGIRECERERERRRELFCKCRERRFEPFI